MNGVILAHSWADATGVTASSEASAALAATRLLEDQPGEPWRSGGAGTHTFGGDFGADRECGVLCAWNHNLGESDTLTLELASEPTFDVGDADYVTHQWPGRYPMYNWAQESWDTGPVGGEASGIYTAPYVAEVFSGVQRRYHNATVARPSGYSQIGRYMIGPAVVPTYNFDWGVDITWVEGTEHMRMSNDSIRPVPRRPHRAGTITWSWLEREDARNWSDILYRMGKRHPVLFIPYPGEQNSLAREKTVYAWIENVSRIREESHAYTLTVTLREAI